MTARRKPAAFTVVKDAVAYFLGVGLILHQALVVPPQDFNPWLLALGGTLVGVPGFGQLISMRTGGSPQQPPDSDLPPPPSPSSSTSGVER